MVDKTLVKEALQQIPDKDKKILRDNISFEDANRYEGKPSGPMFYDENKKTIYFFPETAKSIGPMVHEFGHAIDHSLGWISHTSAFKAIAKQYPDFIGRKVVHGRGSDSKYEEAYARGYAALYGKSTPTTWPGNDSDLARVIRDARLHTRDLDSSLR